MPKNEAITEAFSKAATTGDVDELVKLLEEKSDVNPRFKETAVQIAKAAGALYSVVVDTSIGIQATLIQFDRETAAIAASMN